MDNRLKEALDFFKDWNMGDGRLVAEVQCHLKALADNAEQTIAWQGKMPQKKELVEVTKLSNGSTFQSYELGYNKALEDYTHAIIQNIDSISRTPKVNGEFQCEHSKNNIVNSDCIWCNLTVGEKIAEKYRKIIQKLDVEKIAENIEVYLKSCFISLPELLKVKAMARELALSIKEYLTKEAV